MSDWFRFHFLKGVTFALMWWTQAACAYVIFRLTGLIP